MQVVQTSLPGVIVFQPKVFADERGFFLESYHQQRYQEAGLPKVFVQDNHSCSTQHVLRGLHYQLRFPQGKLVRVIRGEVFDVAVDIRQGSPTFGQWHGEILSAENHRQMYIPEGFAHGFLVLSDQAEFLYKCTDYYHAEDDHGISWQDPTLNITWPITTPILSVKDASLPYLAKAELPQYCDRT